MAAKKDRPTRVARESRPRDLTDAREMRAIAHPVRVALLEALTREGPLTATEAAELVDESPANCSFHLRLLAKYGFVEEAEGGTGRQRPWRRTAMGQSFEELHDDPATSAAAQALADFAHKRTFARVRDFTSNRALYSEEWLSSYFASDALLYMTPEELHDLGQQFYALLLGYIERTADKSLRPEGSGPVHVAVFGHPVPPTASGN
jgi:DNA-binding transcriptional ArsR family regulator